jgi:hypothetical protein
VYYAGSGAWVSGDTLDDAVADDIWTARCASIGTV